ncbi:unnamed protein product [Hymenolepis diminuta]|uniref:Uncharacterized protein n=1 Tax=Hymenolepis diminuta TaxID=6216 RepID=A0A564YIX8_HYMDI|nr:unnamed protein product [Hymenolepis diminuta]VUZ46553.1 unnamed protein product [Hymenolepis diminuta]VUZ46557.1 unnamed protein product [Hymenolepis diminuta]
MCSEKTWLTPPRRKELDSSIRRRLETTVHKKLKRYIRPRELVDLKFRGVVYLLYELFGAESRAFFKCFRRQVLTKMPDEDWIDYVTGINDIFEQPDFRCISNDRFRRLFFFCGQWDSCHADVRVRILKIIEQNHDIILLDFSDEGRRMDTVLDDTAMIE